MTNREQKLLEHEKWLRRNGVHPEQLAEQRRKRKVVLVSIPDYSVEKALPLSDSIEKITYANEKDWQYASNQYTVGQLYNKGGIQVISKTDAADPATGKRRT
jgi:hypothetical protein